MIILIFIQIYKLQFSVTIRYTKMGKDQVEVKRFKKINE